MEPHIYIIENSGSQQAISLQSWSKPISAWRKLFIATFLLINRGCIKRSPNTNTCAITIGFSFQGTWIVTSLMVLANVYLLCWEYDRLKVLLPGVSSPLQFTTQKNLGFWATLVYGGILGLLGLGSFMLGVNIHQDASLWIPIWVIIITLLTVIVLVFQDGNGLTKSNSE